MIVLDLTEIEDYLNAVRIPLRLACKTESGWPVAISLWFHYQDGLFLCATQKSARVVGYLQHDPRCAFEIASDLPPYCGVRGQANATIDEKNGIKVLMQLLERYLGDTNNSFSQNLISKGDDEVAIVLKPVNVFTWDYSNRMQDVVSPMIDLSKKLCP